MHQNVLFYTIFLHRFFTPSFENLKITNFIPCVVSSYLESHDRIIDEFTRSLESYDRAQIRFKEDFGEKRVSGRSEKDRKIYENERQKAKWEVLDKKNKMMRTKVRQQEWDAKMI